jgi:hypothetical protein
MADMSMTPVLKNPPSVYRVADRKKTKTGRKTVGQPVFSAEVPVHCSIASTSH